MHPLLSDDLTHLPDLLDHVRAHAVRVVSHLDDRPVAARVPAPPSRPLPDRGVGLDGVLESFARDWEPGFSGSAGPRYLGFVTGGVTPAALAGDWLTATFDQNVSSRFDSTAADLEEQTVGWLRELFGLDSRHQGTFVSGATMSNTVGLAIAREWLGEQRGVSVAESGVGALGSAHVISARPHSSVVKALSVLGLGRGALRLVEALPGREAIDVAALDDALTALRGEPAIVVANAGTVNTVDFDDLRAIAALRERHRFWLHVDGAFGAFAALSPAHAHLVDGVEEADSICVDLHKWLNVPYDSAVQFTRWRDLQLRVFRNCAAYLGAIGERPDPLHLTPENSRRLRALPAWFSLAAYGRAGHAEIVRRCVDLATRLGDEIAATPGLRLLAPVRLNVVCFTIDVADPTRAIGEFIDKVNATGDVVITPTVLDGVPAVRAALSSWRTTEADIDRVAAVLRRAAG